LKTSFLDLQGKIVGGMSKYISILGLLIFLSVSAWSQNDNTPILDWKEWQAASSSGEMSGKTLVYIYTDWCNLCKKIETEAFANPGISSLIDNNFTLVGFNAENREEMSFQDKKYKFVRDGKVAYHELAAHLLNGRLSFPSIVVFDENMEPVQIIHGYQSVAQLNMVLQYYGKDYYKNTPWTSFQRSYEAKQIADDK
jgi:thioredoxin-related protein